MSKEYTIKVNGEFWKADGSGTLILPLLLSYISSFSKKKTIFNSSQKLYLTVGGNIAGCWCILRALRYCIFLGV